MLERVVDIVEVQRAGIGEWEVVRDIRVQALADLPAVRPRSTLQREAAFDDHEWQGCGHRGRLRRSRVARLRASRPRSRRTRPARLQWLAELLQLPRERLAAWGLVWAVLAEAWHVQDTGVPADGPLRVAQLLASR